MSSLPQARPAAHSSRSGFDPGLWVDTPNGVNFDVTHGWNASAFRADHPQSDVRWKPKNQLAKPGHGPGCGG